MDSSWLRAGVTRAASALTHTSSVNYDAGLRLPESMTELPRLPEGETWDGLHRRFLARVVERDLFTATPARAIFRASSIIVAHGVLWVLLLGSHGWPVRAALLVLTSAVVVQGGLLGHELAHLAITRKGARSLGLLFMTVLGGQANGQWLEQHHGHHQRMQEPLRDPDLEVDVFALSDEAARQKRSIWLLTTRLQRWLFWPAATLMAFSIRVQTALWILRNAPRSLLQGLALCAHFALWLVIPAYVIGWSSALVNCALLTWFIGMFMMASFYWNHLGRPVFRPDDETPFFARCYLGSRCLAGGPLLTTMFGGLNYHVEHHLAPGVPIENLGAARRELVAVLAEVGLELPIWSWSGAMREVHEHLVRVSRVAGRDLPQSVTQPAKVPARP